MNSLTDLYLPMTRTFNDRCALQFSPARVLKGETSVNRGNPPARPIGTALAIRWAHGKRSGISGVVMQGRRSHRRMATANFEGVLSVLHDVVVLTGESGEVLALDRNPHQVGEIAILETMVNNVIVSMKVKVAACRPIVNHGDILHQIRLVPVAAGGKRENS
jgi:hypothetical protein